MAKAFSLYKLSELTETELVGNPDLEISSVGNLESASEKDASFLANSKYNEAMKQSKAGVICIDRKTALIEGKNFLISDNPSRTFQLIAEKIIASTHQASAFKGIHPTAIVHESAKIGKNVTISPHAVIDAYTEVGEGSQIYPNVYIGVGAKIGENCTLYSNSTVRERCILGNRVILQPGAVIGSCGYGYTTDPKTGRHTKLEQLGNVVLEDDVEIGANTTIDRARFKETLIRKGTKLDNLVQVAHNVELGKNNIIVSQTGIAGSSKLGNNVSLGGQAGVVGHVSITDNVKVATRGGISKSITESGIYGGNPASPMPEFNKRQVLLRKIGMFVKDLANLKKRVDILDSTIKKIS
ncbi:MAG: UDP-3-O-(3-hydroxymyristoyl)glucosamine N-acyltransferase [Candidatus Neptunochlamydia sp.]|nr:UDP-3-O-(3-hydroxymyristoyl)glucosamine N-acyltransferase [Candidatus Neptunochlamydia sp.]